MARKDLVEGLMSRLAFLYGDLKPGETFYMEQPGSFEEDGKEDWVWALLKGLYGAPHGGWVWNRTMNNAMLGWGFTRLRCEYCFYFRHAKTGTLCRCSC
jgi:hypothetical protein